MSEIKEKRSPVNNKRDGARRVVAAERGDTAPTENAQAVEDFVVSSATYAAQQPLVQVALGLLEGDQGSADERAKALRSLIEGASPDDQKVLRAALTGRVDERKVKRDPDAELAPDWRDGAYPYKNLLRRSTYEKEKFHLQIGRAHV